MVLNRKITFILTLISVIIGVMLVTQVQSNLKPKQGESTRSIIDLRTTFLKEQEKRKSLSEAIDKQLHLLHQYETSLNEGESQSVMKEELARIRKLAGFESLEDKGVIVRIEDIPISHPLSPEENTTDALVGFQQTYIVDELRWIVNSLYDNGARAIAINNNRLIATSSIRNVGDDIQVDTKPIKPPYEIKALGDQYTLISALKIEEIDQVFQTLNKKVYMEERDKLYIPAYSGNRDIRFMSPVKAKGDS